VRAIAVNIAVATFFVLAIVSAACGATPWACSTRALAGAAAMYLLARVACRVVVSILVEAAVRGDGRGIDNDVERTR
jgi:hypothetical protein